MTITQTTTVTFKMPDEYIELQKFRDSNDTAGWIATEKDGRVYLTLRVNTIKM